MANVRCHFSLTSFCFKGQFNMMQSTEFESLFEDFVSDDKLCNGLESCLRIVFDRSNRTGFPSAVEIVGVVSFAFSIPTH